MSRKHGAVVRRRQRQASAKRARLPVHRPAGKSERRRKSAGMIIDADRFDALTRDFDTPGGGARAEADALGPARNRFPSPTAPRVVRGEGGVPPRRGWSGD